ncbi:hypothetical protein [Clostridium tertium]|uniref:hypothetical protein n=1 Tax=Clostridium tertium TaxID=1559 RepID=UPI000BE36A54|nr:hypothetical protein [Clostridium tertium]
MKWSEFGTDNDYKEDFSSLKEVIKEKLLKTCKLTDIYYDKYTSFIVNVFNDYRELLRENNLEIFENSEYSVIGQVNGKPVLYLYAKDGEVDNPLFLCREKNGYGECVDLIIVKDKKFEVVNEFVSWLYVDKESGELRSRRTINESEEFYKENLEKITDKYNRLEELFTLDNGNYKLIDLVLNIKVSYKSKVVGIYSNGRESINKAIECFE